MFSSKYETPDPKIHKPHHMSYMFGPHMPESPTGIYFGGDQRIVRLSPNEIPIQRGSQPAWLVADWILALKRGEPISDYAQSIVSGAISRHKGLAWLWNLETQ